jgi:hypothetical protein
MKTPQIGEVHYRVTFTDPDLTIPRVEPMVFVGANLFPEHEEQGVASYYFREPLAVQTNANDYELGDEYYCCTEDGLDRYHSLVEVIAQLALVAAGVDLTRPPGSRGLNL